MHFKRTLFVAVAAFLGAALVPVEAAAQTQSRQVRLANYGDAGTINTTEYGTVMASPYQGYFVGDPTTPLIDFFCIDFEHYAPPLGTTWRANVTNLGTGDISLTRHAGETGALTRYRQIAWLLGQRPTVDAANWRAIQLAVWQTFSGTCQQTSRPSYACARNGDAYLNSMAASWRTQAGANYLSADFSHYRIVTGYGSDAGRQEFMYVTPEPETYVLMGSGLLALFFVWRRRRRRGDELLFADNFAGF